MKKLLGVKQVEMVLVHALSIVAFIFGKSL